MSPLPEERRPLRPEDVLAAEPEDAERWLGQLEAQVPVHPTFAELPGAPVREAVVFGDTHGDWRSARAAAERFLEAPAERCLVGLGDYVDRAPDDCGEGSVANALYLLSLVAAYPDRVLLLQGNHESVRTIPVLPHDLPEEVDALWGPRAEIYHRLMQLLERGPLAARSTSGAYLAHAGFPSGSIPADWKESFERKDESLVADLLWRECARSRLLRGLTVPFTEPDLVAFLSRIGTTIFLRGHDPDLAGKSVFHDRCLTLHTSRVYERIAGVLVARLPLDRPVRSTREVTLEHLETEGRSYPEP